MNAKRIECSHLLVAAFFATALACSSPKEKAITNEQGGYVMRVPPEWDYELTDSTTRITQTKYYGTSYVTGTVSVSIMESKYETLEETVTNYIGPLKYMFAEYEKLSEGYTQINGATANWHKMKDTENGVTYITLQYLMQPNGKKLITINCSATEDTFEDFEADFNKIAFSFKTQN